MKFGMPLFGVSPRYYADIARAAEENGFESVWMPEHLVFPETMPPTYLYSESGYPPVSPQTPLYDAFVALGAVAQATDRIRLGTNVYILPLRHPITVARSLVTLDRISNGRVTFGIGVGWLEDEFTAVGLSFADRGRRTNEMIPLMRRLFADEVIEHHGEHFDFAPLAFQPKPRQATLPIEVGGASPAALRRAGRLGDGWIQVGSASYEEVRRCLSVIGAEREASGRAHLPFEVSFERGVRARCRGGAPQRRGRRDAYHRHADHLGSRHPGHRRGLDQALRRRGDLVGVMNGADEVISSA